jgi:hypothetical protein
MTWLAWRQFRLSAIVTGVALVLIATLLLITGLELDHQYYTSGAATCATHRDCDVVTSAYLLHYGLLENLRQIILIVPALVGIFWGAPLLAREFENGTFRLVWTQSVTRTRWLAIKFTMLALAGVAVTEAFTLMEAWWFRPIDKINQDPFSSAFDQTGIAPMGYSLFAFALGVVAGLLIRRTLAAMAVTLVGFIAARVAVAVLWRPHFATPLTRTRAFAAAGSSAGGGLGPPTPVGADSNPHNWVVSSHLIDAAGRTVNNPSVSCNIHINAGHGAPDASAFASAQAAAQACQQQTAVAFSKLRLVTAYQPANRYWPFEFYETAIFTVAALILIGACFWLIRRRLS